MPETPPKEAAELILAGRAPAGLRTGVLQLGLAETKKAVKLPEGLQCYSLSLAGQPLASLPPGLQVEFKLDLTGCEQITKLPQSFSVSTLVLTNCVRLTALPECLDVNFLQLDGCTALRGWPETAQVARGWVRARGCSALEQLPSRLGPLASLDLRGCRRIASIPPGVTICSWVDIGGSRITSLPETVCHVGLRWRGVPVTAQIAFFPETLKGPDILAERNAELRRVMIERMGFEKFLGEVKAELLDSDRDRGGERKLLRVRLTDDEPIVVVSLRCPSTGRQYVVRVPPSTLTCHQAVAWTAGFDNPADYVPFEET
jgi:hypothetical protein